MKKLTEYINNIPTIEDIVESEIDLSILQHLAIEYKLNHIYSRKKVILEKYGVYDGCEEISKYLSKKILSSDQIDFSHEFEREELSKFKNIFFNKLIIDIDTSENKGGMYIDNEKLNDDLLFDEVEIDIYLSEKEIKDQLQETIMHELTHAYNNWMMLSKNDKNYLKVANSDFYQKITDTESENTNEFLVKKALYFLLGYEKNAFFAQIKEELEKNKSKVKTPLDALKILKQSLVYQSYVKLNNEINAYFKGTLTNKNEEEIEKAYEEITGKKEKANKIFKKLKALSEKALKKLDTQLPKMCIENLNNVLVTDDTNMYNYLNS